MGALNQALQRSVFGRSSCNRQVGCYVILIIDRRAFELCRSITRLPHVHVDVEAEYHRDKDAQLNKRLPASRGQRSRMGW